MRFNIILKKISAKISFIKSVAFATYKEWSAYRSHMLVSLVIGPLYFLVQVFIWKAVYSGRDVLNGFTLEQIISYYGIAALIHYCIMDFADWNFQMLIRTGQFITYLLRPMHHRLFAFSQKVGHRILGFTLEFIPVYLIFFFVFKIKLIPAYPLWSIISILLSFIIIFLINYSIGLTAFWLIKADGVRRVFLLFRDIASGIFIPLVFFPETIQKVLMFLPFQYCVYVPVRVFLGSYELHGESIPIPQIVGLQAVMCLVMYLISEFMYNRGVKRFTGVGV